MDTQRTSLRVSCLTLAENLPENLGHRSRTRDPFSPDASPGHEKAKGLARRSSTRCKRQLSPHRGMGLRYCSMGKGEGVLAFSVAENEGITMAWSGSSAEGLVFGEILTRCAIQ